MVFINTMKDILIAKGSNKSSLMVYSSPMPNIPTL